MQDEVSAKDESCTDSLIEQIENLELKSKVAASQTIVVDALNFMGEFFPFDSKKDAGRVFAIGKHRIQQFKHALDNCGWEAIFVFANGQHTTETQEKWESRRLKEAGKESMRKPCGISIFYMSVLNELELKVYHPSGIDGDDAIAKLAGTFHYSVLSQDQDMCRYGLDLKKVYASFAIINNQIHFTRRTYLPVMYISRRSLDDIPIPSDLTEWEPTYTGQIIPNRDGKLKMGNADRFTARFGNLYHLAQPLRAAMYARNGRTSKVCELLPVMRSSGPILLEEFVEPDDALDHLLDDVGAMFDWLQTKSGSPKEREHPSAMITSRIYHTIHPEESVVELYQSLRSIPELMQYELSSQWAGQVCQGVHKHRNDCLGYCSMFEVKRAKEEREPICQKCFESNMFGNASWRYPTSHRGPVSWRK